MTPPLSAYNTQILSLLTEPLVSFPANLSTDPTLLALGYRGEVQLAPNALPNQAWALRFAVPLSTSDLLAAIARVRFLIPLGIRDLGPVPRRFFCCVDTCLEKRAWAAYPPGWHLTALGSKLDRGSNPVSITVLDSGADLTHPSLTGLPTAFTSTPLTDRSGHGTHVVSTICGREWGTPPPIVVPDDYQVAYVPPGILSGLKINLASIAQANTLASAFEVDWVLYTQALNAVAAATSPVQILNLSIGGPAASIVEQTLLAKVSQKTLILAAAGNHEIGDPWDRVLYPAGYPECLSVGASSRETVNAMTFADIVWDRNNDNVNSPERLAAGRKTVDLYAPGRNIVGALPVDASNAFRPCGYKSGTSMATAYATGVFGLRYSYKAPTPDPWKEALTLLAAFPKKLNGIPHLVNPL